MGTIQHGIVLLMSISAAGLAAACGSPAPAAGRGAALPSRSAVRAARPSTAARLSSPSLTDLAMRDRRDGYGLFVRNGGGRCQAGVARTEDGGARFGALVPVTSWLCANGATVSRLVFAGPNGFLYGPRLFTTRDGGRTWAPDSQPGAVLAMAAAGRSVWMVEAACPDGGQTGRHCRLRVLQSADGGRSWAPSPAQPRAFADIGAGEMPVGSNWLLRTGPAAGYVVDAPVPNPRGRPNFVSLWHTANGGQSWSRRRLPCLFDALSAAVSAAPDGTLLGVCAGEPSAGWEMKSTARSANGGRTWIAAHLPCVASARSCRSPLDFGYLSGIDAVTGEVAFLYGWRSSLLVTRDGGARWRVVRALTRDTTTWSGPVVFFGQFDGLALADGGPPYQTSALFRTRDGGAHWSRITPVVR